MIFIGIVSLNLVWVLVGVLIYVRLQKLHGQIKHLKKSLSAEVVSQNRSLYEQLECLLGLYRELNMRDSFPPCVAGQAPPTFCGILPVMCAVADRRLLWSAVAVSVQWSWPGACS